MGNQFLSIRLSVLVLAGVCAASDEWLRFCGPKVWGVSQNTHLSRIGTP